MVRGDDGHERPGAAAGSQEQPVERVDPGQPGNLSNLETLALVDSQLSGSIPSSLGNLSNLKGLYLHSTVERVDPEQPGEPETLRLSPGNDELCAPNDEAFQAWLKSIGDLNWTGPTCTPGAPTGLTATAGDGEVTLSWTAPTNTGAAAITGYEYEVDGVPAPGRRRGRGGIRTGLNGCWCLSRAATVGCRCVL